jgi:hypothetical protein
VTQAEEGEPSTGTAVRSLAAEVLAAAGAGEEAGGLAERIASAPPAEGRAAVLALGGSREPAAGPILAAVAEGRGGGSKELRKEARRGLHRLRAVGLEVPRPSGPPVVSPFAERPVVVVEAWGTISDGVGSRALWLTAERPLGGAYGVAVALNEIVGMKACLVEDTTRRRFAARIEEWRRGQPLTVVQLPNDYVPQLIGEALELNRESGFTIPREWLLRQQALAGLVRPFERAVVYDEIPAAEVALNPELLEESSGLLEEPELQGWFFGFDEVRSFALDMLQARQSQIVLSEQLQAERQQRIVANAIREVVTPPVQRGLTRRLEEAAFVFLRTERGRRARQALAAARRLGEGTLSLNPLLVAMMQKSLELASQVETAKIPIELVRRSPYDPIE